MRTKYQQIEEEKEGLIKTEAQNFELQKNISPNTLASGKREEGKKKKSKQLSNHSARTKKY